MFNTFFQRVRDVFRRTEITDDLYEELEEALILADVSSATASALVERLRIAVRAEGAKDSERAYVLLQGLIAEMLSTGRTDIPVCPIKAGTDRNVCPTKPNVILVVGVNGVGKTTTIAKLAARLQGEGARVLLAAADTFRAAAGEQLDIWGERLGIQVIRGRDGADPSSVVYDALAAAKARGADYLIVDTAGRLHTKKHLMEELKKMQRIISRELGRDVDEVLLVLDAGTGRNALTQAKEFAETTGLTGIVLAKCDGTAKGGAILSIAAEIPVAIRYLGTGEKVTDLQPFDAEEFARQLLPNGK